VLRIQSSVSLEQLVSFRVANQELAVPIQLVQEIVKLPTITKVPRAPDYVEGMGNLRGEILPIINLRRRLGFAPQEPDEQTRVVVIHSKGTLTGVIVDAVSEVMGVDARTLEPPPASLAGVEGQYLRSVAKVNDGKRLVMILDESRVLPDALGTNQLTNPQQMGEGTSVYSSDVTHESEVTDQLVSFRVGREEFAVYVRNVREIIRVAEITPIPQVPAYVLGVMSLRHHLLPVVDMARRFYVHGGKTASLAPLGQESQDNQRIIVLDLDGFQTGVRVDSVSQVLQVERSSIDEPPTIFKTKGVDCLLGVGKLNKGKRLLMLLDASKLIPADDRKRLAHKTEDHIVNGTLQQSSKIDDELKSVCFRIDHEEYALDIMRVQEIIRLREITRVPQSPDYVEGIINLRGVLVPVVDMRSRFGLEKRERADENRIVITTIHGKITGLIVDSVSEVIRLPRADIEAAPTTGGGLEDRFIEGIGKLNGGKRVLILIRLEALLDEQVDKAA